MSGLRWRSELNKLVITSNLEARGWQAARNEDEWDIWWASVSSVQQLFAPNSLVKLRPGQLVNHFPNHYELTHKVRAYNFSRRSMYAQRAAVSSWPWSQQHSLTEGQHTLGLVIQCFTLLNG
jgi:hypothetical protein